MGKSTWGRVQNCFRHEIPVVFSQWSLVDSIHFSQQIVLPKREAYLSLGVQRFLLEVSHVETETNNHLYVLTSVSSSSKMELLPINYIVNIDYL